MIQDFTVRIINICTHIGLLTKEWVWEEEVCVAYVCIRAERQSCKSKANDMI